LFVFGAGRLIQGEVEEKRKRDGRPGTVEARGHGLWGVCGAGPTQAEEQRRVKQPLYVVR